MQILLGRNLTLKIHSNFIENDRYLELSKKRNTKIYQYERLYTSSIDLLENWSRYQKRLS